MRILCLLAFIASPALAASDWQQAFHRFSAEISEEEARFPSHGFDSALWGAIQSYRTKSLAKSNFPERDFPSNFFATGKLRVGFIQQKTKRPLAIVVSGFGAGLASPIARRSTYFFASRGYHVLSLPNPWSAEFIHAKPQQRAGALMFEAAVVRSLIQQAKELIGVNNITRTDYYGESYGAFLGSIVLADPKMNNMVDGRILLVSPPNDIKQAFSNLDELISVYEQQWRSQCSGALRSLWIARDFGMHMRSDAMTPFSQKCGKSLMIEEGFYNPLKATIKAVDRTYKLGKISNYPWASNEHLEQVSFAKTIANFLPRAATLLRVPGVEKLSYWLRQTPAELRSRIVVIQAKNDFLNRGQAPENLAEIIPHAILQEWGGHLGAVGLPSWSRALDECFGESKKPAHKLTFWPFRLGELPEE